MLKTPKRLLVVFSVVAPTMLVMSVAFACTLLVGSTQQLTPAAGEGEETQAKGEVVLPADDFQDRCPGEFPAVDDKNCTYDYIVVDPNDALDNDAGRAGSPSCHYDTHEYGIADDNVTHTEVDDAVMVLEGKGPVPSKNVDGSDNGQGVTVTCFVSETRNGADNGQATATQPAPFYKTD
jgi:hypothetical protein